MARPAPLPPTSPPWQLSSSHSLTIPQTFPFLRLHSRFTIFHSVRTRNVNFDSWRFGDDDDADDAEFVKRRRRNGRRSRPRRWWFDINQVEGEQEGGILEQVVHGLWIFQVFRSYGLFLPIILISLLLATGPKAFLVGSGVPFGLSLLAFAFKKMPELLDSSLTPKPKHRHKKSRFRSKRDFSMEGKDSQTQETQQDKRSEGRSYRSKGTSFGGWDELVTEDEGESTEKSSVTKARFEMMTKRKVGSSLEKEICL